jgi:hypothetical protein
MRWVNSLKSKLSGLWSKKRSRSRKAEATPAKWDPARTMLALTYLGVAVAIAGPVVFWSNAEEQLSQYVSAQQALAPTPADVHLLNVPPWILPAQQQQFRTQVASQFQRDPLERSSLERAQQVMAASPWVESVSRVERSGSTIEVAANYRRPAALVKVGEDYRLIDGSGVLLPGLYRPDRMPIIEGVAAAPPREGRPWSGTQVQVGLTMIRLAASQPWMNQVRAFDVGQTDTLGRVRIVLWTGTGRDLLRDSHVVWGLPPGKERPVEPEAATKLAWLAGIVQQPQTPELRGTIDAGHRIVELNGGTAFTRDLIPAVPGVPPAPTDPIGGTRYTLLR